MKSHSEAKPVCAICGIARNIEHNHAGGRNHIAWFKVPFCELHHQQFHRMLENVGINLRYTPNKMKRLVTASHALTIALWMVMQALMEASSALPDQNDSPKKNT